MDLLDDILDRRVDQELLDHLVRERIALTRLRGVVRKVEALELLVLAVARGSLWLHFGGQRGEGLLRLEVLGGV